LRRTRAGKLLAAWLAAALIMSGSVPVYAEIGGESSAERDTELSAFSIESADPADTGEILVVMDKSESRDALDIAEGDEVVGVQETESQKIITVKPSGENADASIRSYEEAAGVDYVQPNYEYNLLETGAEAVYAESIAADDPRLSSQWSITDADTGLTDAWGALNTYAKVKVAVIDTGVLMTHEDLAANIDAADSYDIVNDTAEMTDPYGHGTEVAGVIAAVTNNAIGVSGTADNHVSICCYNVFKKQTTGKYTADTASIVTAYGKALDAGCKVINMSLGGYESADYSDQLLTSMINTAQEQGVLTVCAGGNGDGVSKGYTKNIFPGDLDACVAVVPTDVNNKRAAYADYNSGKDISAPGVNILTTSHTGEYGYASGSSLAAPYVSGVAALALALNPILTADQIKEILYSTATDLGDAGLDDYYGYGLVNAKAALAAVSPIEYQTHVQNVGWQDYVSQGLLDASADAGISGTVGQGLRAEAFSLSLTNGMEGIYYDAHVENIGWQNGGDDISNWFHDGETAGTTGKALRMEALRIQLSDELASVYDVYYRVHVQDIGWMNWKSNGAIAGTTGLALRIEAIQVQLLPKGAAPSDIGNDSASVYYEGLVQGRDWSGPYKNGDVLGTTGQSLRLEGLRVYADIPVTAGFGGNAEVSYSAHVQDIGWQDFMGSGGFAGKRDLRLEALRLRLDDITAGMYSIRYSAHVQNIGWQDYASDGAVAGTTGECLRMEAIMIRLEKK